MEKSSACNLCGGNNPRLLFKKEGYSIVQCQNCGLIYINPRDNKEIVKKRYSEPYFHIKNFQKKNPTVVGYWDYISDRPVYEEYFEEKIRQLEKIKPTPGRILDIGCSLGFFLNRAKAHGWQTHGVEISQFAASYAQRKFGHQILLGEIKPNSFPKQYFDVITMYQTIEHLLDPLQEMKLIHSLLKKNGLIVITTPNTESLIAQLTGKKWFAYRPREHFYNFSPKTIRAMLEKAGFNKIITKRDNYVAYPLERILERITYNFRSKFFLNLVKFFNKVLKVFRLSKLKIKIPVGDIMVIGFK